jgi:hypothetical protein
VCSRAADLRGAEPVDADSVRVDLAPSGAKGFGVYGKI